MRILKSTILVLLVALSARAELEPVVLSKDGRGFELASSGQRFIPWGHNYGSNGKLLEDVWDTDWSTVAQDFREMKEMGANVVRVHLQVGKFMDAADRPNAHSLEQLSRLLRLAEDVGIYLDITGLACYRPADVPKWYDPLPRDERWQVQARFWKAVAETASTSPAVFCYDLMNEPVVPGEQRKPGQWYSGKLLGEYDFVQFISLDAPAGPRYEVAREWIKTLTTAIREKDQRHLITVGLLPWSQKWRHLSGFVPEKVAPELDFISVHIYPENRNLAEATECLKQFAVGKPLVIEETFNLSCSAAELRQFLLASRGTACGWIGHYDGQTIADYDALKNAGRLTMPQAFMREWLKLFQSGRPEMMAEEIGPAK